LLKIVLLGYSRGLISSRRIERATYDSVAVPVHLKAERRPPAERDLANKQMEALVRSTPEISDRALVRDIRRSGIVIGRLGLEQDTPAVREQVEALEKLLLEAATMADDDATARDTHHQPDAEPDRQAQPVDAEQPTRRPRPPGTGAAAAARSRPAAPADPVPHRTGGSRLLRP